MKDMRAVISCIIVIGLVFLSVPAFCAYEKGDFYRAVYECRDLGGNFRWKGVAEIRHKSGDVYTITEKLSGRYYGFDGNISWVAVTELERNKETVIPLSMDQKIYDGSGKLIEVRKQEFNLSDKTVTCTYEYPGNGTSFTKSYSYHKDIINRLLQGLYVQKFLENGDTRRQIQLISPEPALYNLELRVVGQEEIDVGGKKRKAFKLVFDPQLGLLSFVKIFLPKAYVWHSAEPRYELLKYEGIETSIKSPEVVITTLESGIVNESGGK